MASLKIDVDPNALEYLRVLSARTGRTLENVAAGIISTAAASQALDSARGAVLTAMMKGRPRGMDNGDSYVHWIKAGVPFGVSQIAVDRIQYMLGDGLNFNEYLDAAVRAGALTEHDSNTIKLLISRGSSLEKAAEAALMGIFP